MKDGNVFFLEHAVEGRTDSGLNGSTQAGSLRHPANTSTHPVFHKLLGVHGQDFVVYFEKK